MQVSIEIYSGTRLKTLQSQLPEKARQGLGTLRSPKGPLDT